MDEEESSDGISFSQRPRTCFSKPDPHWGWVVVYSSFVANFIFAGFANSCGIYYIEWLDHFDGNSRSEISWIGSLLLGMTCMTSPVGAILSERYGDRPIVMVGSALAALSLMASAYVTNVYLLMVTYGVITGFGFSMICMIMATVPMYFFDEKHVGLAIGLALSGNGCGSFVMPLIIEMLIEAYGWRGSLLICSGIVLNCCVCGALLRKPERGIVCKDNAKPKKPLVDVTVLKSVSVVLFLLSQLIFSFGLSTVYVHAAALVEKMTGVTRTKSAGIISTVGVMNFVGRITHGAIAGFKSVNIFTQYGVCCLINAASLFLLPNIPFYPVSVVITAAFGFCIAPYGSLMQLIVQKMAGMDNLKIVYGLFVFMSGVGWMAGAPIAGLLYDATGDYGTSMYFGGSAMIGCVAFFLKTWIDGTCRKAGTTHAHHIDISVGDEVSNS
ncbi:monocarboxylate transporter 9-like [Lineus longissimus]|uniref:monocarboxylate transporter 9-like n=1 Tax=Lineus longissimus TaxID=88925 RepID=UPI002B4F0D63